MSYDCTKLEDFNGVWVFCEQREGKLMPTDLELVSEARKLADELGSEVTALLLGDNMEAAARELGGYGADKVWLYDSPMLGVYNTDAYSKVICDAITEGKPVVTDLLPIKGDERALLTLAASLETMSGHPLAEAIVARAQEENLPLHAIEDYELLSGQGIRGRRGDTYYWTGNQRLMETAGVALEQHTHTAERLAREGKTALFCAENTTLVGIIAAADVVKATSKEAISQLTALGLDVVMLTGDNAQTAEAIRRQVGLNRVIAEVLPQDKERHVRLLQEQGHKVAMVGDGINDAPALARADVGIALGAGTDIALESADIVLMKSDLLDVPRALELSRAVLRTIKQNLFWAFIYNVIGIPLAAGVLYPSLGLLLNPMIAAAAMSFSSVSVVGNALRLRFFTPLPPTLVRGRR